MKTLTITRGQNTPEGTFGKAELIAGAQHQSFYSVELPWKGNANKVSCIPAGQYKAAPFMSPRFKRSVLLLQDVPGRSMIEIHPGNWGGDETYGWYSDLNGCIALGFGKGPLRAPNDAYQMAVLRSKAAHAALMSAVGKDTIIVNIEESIA